MLRMVHGTRDFFGEEAKKKRQLETTLANLFSEYGYEEIVTPMLEYVSTLTKGSHASEGKQLFTLFDEKNKNALDELSLRHEMTTPIARVVGVRHRLGEEFDCLKFFYISNVYRREQTQMGRQCEFYQAGVELIGGEEKKSDIEILSLALHCLQEVGLNDFRLCVGHVGFMQEILKTILPHDEAAQKNLKYFLEKHNLVSWRNYVEALQTISNEEKEILLELPMLNGSVEILDKAAELSARAKSDGANEAIQKLRDAVASLKPNDVKNFLGFDLGLVRDFDYYTGIVMEAYTPKLGYALLGGGRYDNLLAEFGVPKPAIGFALGIERLMLALEK